EVDVDVAGRREWRDPVRHREIPAEPAAAADAAQRQLSRLGRPTRAERTTGNRTTAMPTASTVGELDPETREAEALPGGLTGPRRSEGRRPWWRPRLLDQGERDHEPGGEDPQVVEHDGRVAPTAEQLTDGNDDTERTFGRSVRAAARWGRERLEERHARKR